MRDVLLLRFRERASVKHVLSRALAILADVHRGMPSLEHEVWLHRRARLAMIQSSWKGGGDVVPMHRLRREAFAYTGFVANTQYGAPDVRKLLSMDRNGELTLEDSPGGVAAFFFASAWSRRAYAWSSHAGIRGVYVTKGEECIAIGSSPLACHLVGLQRGAPVFSRLWARRVLLGGGTLWDDTPYDRTFQPPPRKLVVLHEDEVRHEPHPIALERQRYSDRDPAGLVALNAAALEAVAVLRRWPQGELQLSGGKDSRFVAALLRKAGIAADNVTHAGLQSGEGATAAAVAHALGVKHRITGGPGIPAGDELVSTILYNLRLSDGMLGENRQLAARQLKHAGEPLIQGQAHHPRGGFRVRAVRSRPAMTSDLIAKNIGDQELVIDDVVRERERRLHEVLDGYPVKFVPDLSYWMYSDWRMTRWVNAAYRATSRFRPVLWPLMDERVLRVISELSCFDRLSEVAFYAAMTQLSPELKAVPLYEDIWKFDGGPVGPNEFPDGHEARKQPFKDQGRGGPPTAERLVSTIQPLFRLATQELSYAEELRSLIRPAALEALSTQTAPAAVLGRPPMQILNFMWKATAVALVLEGDWLRADSAQPGAAARALSSSASKLAIAAAADGSGDATKAPPSSVPAGPPPLRRFRLQLPGPREGSGDAALIEVEAPASFQIPKELQAAGLSTYEPDTVACFLACMETAGPGPVLDIGANIGVFAWVAARVGGRATIAFEPTPETAEWAVTIARKNGLSLDVEPIALGGEPGTVPLFLSGTSDLSNSTRAGFRQATGTVEVAMDTVDRVCERRAIRPAVMKIDTETTEPDVLRGAARVLTEHRPWIICEVLGKSTEARLQEAFAPYDYSWFQITHETPLVARREIFGDRSGTYRNWLFAPTMPGPEFWASMRHWREELRRCGTSATRTQLAAPAFRFESSAHGAIHELGWQPRRSSGFVAEERGATLSITCALDPNVRVLFFHGSRELNGPDVQELRVPLSPPARYEVTFDVEADPSEMPGIFLYANQYDGAARVQQQRVWARPGSNVLAFDAEPQATSLRLAFRFSGRGKVTIGPLRFSRVDG